MSFLPPDPSPWGPLDFLSTCLGNDSLNKCPILISLLSCLSLCLSLNSFRPETSKSRHQVSDSNQDCGFRSQSQFWPGSSPRFKSPGSSPQVQVPRLKCMVSISRTCEYTILLGKQNFSGQGLKILRRKEYPALSV